jgi:SsrA-binding protein
MGKKPAPEQRRILNKKARHDYHILETIEAGISLTGTEVKSIRAGAAQITEAFVRVNGFEATLYGAQIDRYPPATDRNHDPKRNRRLLLHRRELEKLTTQLAQRGMTLVPLSIFFNSRGLAKVELGLATGKREFDKREDLRKREHQREMDRATAPRRK